MGAGVTQRQTHLVMVENGDPKQRRKMREVGIRETQEASLVDQDSDTRNPKTDSRGWKEREE